MKAIEEIIRSRRKCIVRAEKAGVFYGVISEYDGGTVEIRQCRRIWYWDGAASLSELAECGPKRDGNKFSVTVESMVVTGVSEIIPCTPEAVDNIDRVPVWRA